MADNKDVFSANDALEINELMSLNNDISNDFIEQLQNQISTGAGSNTTNEDAALFEEPAAETSSSPGEYEDDFIRKFNEKKRKRQMGITDTPQAEQPAPEKPAETEVQTVNEPVQEEVLPVQEEVNPQQPVIQSNAEQTAAVSEIQPPQTPDANQDIDIVSGGNITEKKLDKDFIKYKKDLDYADSNTKYSKYIVYIDPENQEFMDSLTVKERKNLINRIIREQDSVAVTKRKLKNMQIIITHIIIAILTVTIAIPVIYFMINASLEATINNYKNSQTTFGQLYKTHSKIKPINN